MIRLYSELDRKRRHRFGKRNIKGVPAVCCAQVALSFSFCFLFFLFFPLSFYHMSFFHMFILYLYFLLIFNSIFMQGVTTFRGKTQSPIFSPVSYGFRENVRNRFLNVLQPTVCSPFTHII
jgi:hypothetical protein